MTHSDNIFAQHICKDKQNQGIEDLFVTKIMKVLHKLWQNCEKSYIPISQARYRLGYIFKINRHEFGQVIRVLEQRRLVSRVSTYGLRLN